MMLPRVTRPHWVATMFLPSVRRAPTRGVARSCRLGWGGGSTAQVKREVTVAGPGTRIVHRPGQFIEEGLNHTWGLKPRRLEARSQDFSHPDCVLPRLGGQLLLGRGGWGGAEFSEQREPTQPAEPGGRGGIWYISGEKTRAGVPTLGSSPPLSLTRRP